MVARADLPSTMIGERSSVQEHCQIHGNPGRPATIGDYVTQGHGAIVHAGRVEEYVAVGMNASVLDGAVVGSGSIISANALVK